ncbi:MAG: hypothetical protein ACC618_03945 [Patescibacteria group bacterium]
MQNEREKGAEEIEQEAVKLLAKGGGLMSFDAYEEALKNEMGLLNPEILRVTLEQKGLIEGNEDKNYVRLPFEPPQSTQA